MRLLPPLALVLAALPLSLFACVGDEPTTQAPGSNTLVDAGVTPPADHDASPFEDAADASADAAPTCAAPSVACGSECAELATSADHCGACGHSCGGGTCTAGQCGVATLRDNIERGTGFGIDAASVYFGSADKLFSCPLGACTSSAPKQLVAMIAYDAERPVIDSGFMYFLSAPNQNTERPAVYRCPIDGCPNPPSSIVSDGLHGIGRNYRVFQKSLYAHLNGSGLNCVDCSSGTCAARVTVVPNPLGPFAVDAQRIYFDDAANESALTSCPSTGCGTRTVISNMPVMGGIEVADDRVYFIGPGTVSGGHGVYACPATGGCAKPTPLVRTASLLDNLAADAHGIFWTEAGVLLGCANVACSGGPKTLVTGLTDVRHVQLDTKFIYFETAGTRANTRAIHRLAR